MTKNLPEILWAQRKDKLYLTVNLQDCEAPNVNVSNNAEETSGRFEFTGIVAGQEYAIEFDLFGAVCPDEAKISYTPRNIFVLLPKKEEGDHWPRLTSDKGKHAHIKVDWGKYIDQDDEESGADAFTPDLEGMGGLGGMGGGFGGMGGMGGAGGMDMAKLQAMMAAQGAGAEGDDKDSDDDDLPDLEA